MRHAWGFVTLVVLSIYRGLVVAALRRLPVAPGVEFTPSS